MGGSPLRPHSSAPIVTRRRYGWPQALVVALISLGLLPRATGTEVNHANQAELEMVKGIGPQLSEQILAQRRQARFTNWQNFVARLHGVGPAKAAKLSAAGLTVEGLPYQAAVSDVSAAPAGNAASR